MLVVECIDATNISVLLAGSKYYAFPVNSSHAYISKFPNKNAHTGCYSLTRFVEVPQVIKQKEPYVYHYFVYATKKILLVYGFQVSNQLIAIYRDAQIKQFIGCVPVERCTAFQKLEPVTSWGSYQVSSGGIRLSDAEGVLEVCNEVIVEETGQDQYEQLCLF